MCDRCDKLAEREFLHKQQMDEAQHKIEQQKLDLERRKLEREHDRFLKEEKHHRMSIVISSVSTILALFTIAFGIWSVYKTSEMQNRTSQAQFSATVASTVLSSPYPQNAKNKADAMEALFPDLLPKDFSDRVKGFRPEDYGQDFDPEGETKLQFLKLVSEHPENTEKILDAWKNVYADKWLHELKMDTEGRAGQRRNSGSH